MARYYYAGGERVGLELDGERVAVDAARAEAAGLGELAARARADGTKLPGGQWLAPRASLAAGELARLEALGGAWPVYRRGAATVVPMPEVRVELEPGGRDAALRALTDATVPSDITERTADRLVARPKSGSGEDALTLANSLVERAKPAAASVRMVQIVPRPDVRRR